MKNMIFLVLLAFLTSGCLDNSDSGSVAGTPPELIDTWAVWQIDADGMSQLFTSANISIGMDDNYSGFIYDYQGVGNDVEYSGTYYCTGQYINIDMGYTSNPDIIILGTNIYYYELTGDQLYISYDSHDGRFIEIWAVRL